MLYEYKNSRIVTENDVCVSLSASLIDSYPYAELISPFLIYEQSELDSNKAIEAIYPVEEIEIVPLSNSVAENFRALESFYNTSFFYNPNKECIVLPTGYVDIKNPKDNIDFQDLLKNDWSLQFVANFISGSARRNIMLCKNEADDDILEIYLEDKNIFINSISGTTSIDFTKANPGIYNQFNITAVKTGVEHNFYVYINDVLEAEISIAAITGNLETINFFRGFSGELNGSFYELRMFKDAIAEFPKLDEYYTEVDKDLIIYLDLAKKDNKVDLYLALAVRFFNMEFMPNYNIDFKHIWETEITNSSIDIWKITDRLHLGSLESVEFSFVYDPLNISFSCFNIQDELEKYSWLVALPSWVDEKDLEYYWQKYKFVIGFMGKNKNFIIFNEDFLGYMKDYYKVGQFNFNLGRKIYTASDYYVVDSNLNFSQNMLSGSNNNLIPEDMKPIVSGLKILDENYNLIEKCNLQYPTDKKIGVRVRHDF